MIDRFIVTLLVVLSLSTGVLIGQTRRGRKVCHYTED